MRAAPGPVLQRALYGWATVLCIIIAGVEAVLRNATAAVLWVNLALSFQALWKTTVVEVKADPHIDDPKSSVEEPGDTVAPG